MNVNGGNKNNNEDMPLFKYAAEHWTSHTQVGDMSSHIKDTMVALFDLNKPYFLAWIQIHDLNYFYEGYSDPEGERRVIFEPQPLYYAALYGFYDLVQNLIVKNPEQVNDRGGNHASPLVAALSGNYLRVAELLAEMRCDLADYAGTGRQPGGLHLASLRGPHLTINFWTTTLVSLRYPLGLNLILFYCY